MFNPVIIISIFIQSIVTKSNRIAGAIIGYIITTGILLWGISVYEKGNWIQLFGIKFTQPLFLIACLAWYGFDTRTYMSARKVTLVEEHEHKRQSWNYCSQCGKALGDTADEQSILRQSLCNQDKQTEFFCSKCGEKLLNQTDISSSTLQSGPTQRQGTNLPKDNVEYECSECKQILFADDIFCPNCGVKL